MRILFPIWIAIMASLGFVSCGKSPRALYAGAPIPSLAVNDYKQDLYKNGVRTSSIVAKRYEYYPETGGQKVIHATILGYGEAGEVEGSCVAVSLDYQSYTHLARLFVARLRVDGSTPGVEAEGNRLYFNNETKSLFSDHFATITENGFVATGRGLLVNGITKELAFNNGLTGLADEEGS